MYTFIQEAQTNIYIGKNAGKRVRSSIKNATSSIRIISPYLSDGLIKDLNKKQKEGIDIDLVTSSEILKAPKVGEIMRQLVEQVRTVRPKAMKIHNFGKLAFFPAILLFLGSGYMTYKGFINAWHCGGFVLGTILFLSLLGQIRTYDYSYRPTINTKCLLSPGTEGYGSGLSLFHAKIYVIDNKTAYLGSLNYTWPGMKYNIETCVEVLDLQSIQDLSSCLDLALEEGLEKDLLYYAPKFYTEPKN